MGLLIPPDKPPFVEYPRLKTYRADTVTDLRPLTNPEAINKL